MREGKDYVWISTLFWRRYEEIVKDPNFRFCDKSVICCKCNHWAMGTIITEQPVKYYCRYCLVEAFGERGGKW